MDSTWETRELPVLNFLVQHFDTVEPVGDPSDQALQKATGLEQSQINIALAQLFHADPPYITGTPVAEWDYPARLSGVTERARRAVGQWPTPEGLADRIVAALNEAAEVAATPADRTRLKRAADAVGGVGKGVLTGVIAHVITQGR